MVSLFLQKLLQFKNYFICSTANPGVTVSMPTPPTEDDEELTVEIRETTDPLDHTVTINEIRFINNGIDVTANVKKEKSLGSQDSLDESDDDEDDTKSIIRKQTDGLMDRVEEEIDENVEDVKDTVQAKADTIGNKIEEKFSEAKESLENAAKDAGESVDAKISGAKDTIGTAAMKAATGAKGAVEAVSENAKKAAKGAKHTMESMGNSAAKATDDARQALENMGNNAVKATGEAKDSMGNAIRKMAGDTRHAVGAVTSKISNEVLDAKNSLSSLLQGKKNKVDVEVVPPDIQETTEELHAQVSAKESGGCKTNPTSQSTSTPGGAQEDDERTTASVNSAQTSAGGNPFENNNPFESNNPFENEGTIPYDPELNAMIERSKKAFQEDVERASMATERHVDDAVDAAIEEKSKFSKFIDDMREKSKSLSCRNEKAVHILEGKKLFI